MTSPGAVTSSDFITRGKRSQAQQLTWSLNSGLVLQVTYPPLGFLARRYDFGHVWNARFLAQSLQLSFLRFGNFGHVQGSARYAQRLQNDHFAFVFPSALF
jgi:hypothetical protein